MVGGSLLQPQSVLLVAWQATLKLYKHQITHLGRVDIVISAEIFFFCCEISGVKRGKTRREGPDLPFHPVIRAGKAKKEYISACPLGRTMMTCVSTLACAALLVALILAAHRLIDAIACAVSRRRLRAKVAAWTPPGVSWIARQQRVVVIVNPNAGAGWGDCVYEDVVRPMLRRAGIEHEVVRTTCAGMAEREAAELASRKVPVDCLLSVSGDGQLHECLNGLRGGGTGGRTALAVVPAGTGNGMSDTCFGRGSDAFEALCSILCASGPTPVDVMRLTYPDEPARTPRHDLHFFCWAAFADHDYVTENGWRWLGPLLKVALAPLYVIAQRRG